jgi:hypothetical protein
MGIEQRKKPSLFLFLFLSLSGARARALERLRSTSNGRVWWSPTFFATLV